MVLRVSIPSFRKVKDEEDSYTVFLLDVWAGGQHNVIEKRYSEFEELHKQFKKIMKTPEFPPKKVLKWNSKVLEQRRMGLETYIQAILEYDPLPWALFAFLETEQVTEEFEKNEEEQCTTHQPMIVFDANAYLYPNQKGCLPDIVHEGVMTGLYYPSCHSTSIILD